MPNVVDRQLQQQLVMLREQLIEVVRAKDWEAIGSVDLLVRDCLQKIAALEAPSAELLNAKAQLRDLYARVLPTYGEVCENVRQLLASHVNYSEGRSAYLRTDLLRSDR